MGLKVKDACPEKYGELADRAIGGLVSKLALISDPRGRQGVLHRFSDVLAILVLGSVCGCDDAEALEEWANKEEEWLSGFLQLRSGIPAQDTYLRALASMEPKPFQKIFRQWAEEVLHMLGVKGQIAIDGKTVRGARSTNQSKSPVHMVSALACEQGLVMGQLKVGEKTNEITAMPELLRMLSLKGSLVSSDAMGCQVEIAQTIVDGEGDYLFGLKGNQKTLASEVEQLFVETDDPRKRAIDEVPCPVVEHDEEVDAGHGRIETRRVSVCHGFEAWVPAAERFPKLCTLIRVHSTVLEKATDKERTDQRYYISSRHLNATEAGHAVRAHWAIENRLHWCLDVVFDEDACRIRTHYAAENQAVVRHFALGIMRAYTGDKLSLRRRRRRCDYDLDYRMKVLAAAAS